MIQILLSILLAISVVGSTPVQADEKLIYPDRGGDAPFPWGTEAPFPWKVVNGVWKTQKYNFYFDFEAINTADPKTKYLKVVIRGANNQLLGQGVAVVRDGDRILRARVVGATVDAYALIRAYDRHVPRRNCGANCAMVVTLRRSETSQGHDVHYLLDKVANKPGTVVRW